MAMVAAISPGCIQTYHHLVPPLSLAQVLREASQTAFGQPFELTHHLLTLLHRVEAVHPEHDFDLDLQGQHSTKRLVLRIH